VEQGITPEATVVALEWVHWFNHRRLFEPPGFIPPAEAEENYCAATAVMDKIPMAA
jgi:putative transposase